MDIRVKFCYSGQAPTRKDRHLPFLKFWPASFLYSRPQSLRLILLDSWNNKTFSSKLKHSQVTSPINWFGKADMSVISVTPLTCSDDRSHRNRTVMTVMCISYISQNEFWRGKINSEIYYRLRMPRFIFIGKKARFHSWVELLGWISILYCPMIGFWDSLDNTIKADAQICIRTVLAKKTKPRCGRALSRRVFTHVCMIQATIMLHSRNAI